MPVMAGLKRYGALDLNDRVTWHFKDNFMWLWDNYEDGIANDTYWKAPNMFLQIVYWSCLRNPVNNLRIVKFLSCHIKPEKVKFVGSFGHTPSVLMKDNPVIADSIYQYDTKIPQWFFAWQDFYSTFYWQFRFFKKLYRFWIGWKIYPTDIYGVTEYRKFGAGFTLQFKKVK